MPLNRKLAPAVSTDRLCLAAAEARRPAQDGDGRRPGALADRISHFRQRIGHASAKRLMEHNEPRQARATAALSAWDRCSLFYDVTETEQLHDTMKHRFGDDYGMTERSFDWHARSRGSISGMGALGGAVAMDPGAARGIAVACIASAPVWTLVFYMLLG